MQRCILWDEANSAVFRGRGSNARLNLSEGFPYVPFKPLLRLAYVAYKAEREKREYVIIPDSVAWDEANEEEIDSIIAS